MESTKFQEYAKLQETITAEKAVVTSKLDWVLVTALIDEPLILRHY